MPIYDFACACGWSTERLVPMGTDTIPCACGAEATKVWKAFPAVITDDIPGGVTLDNYGPEPVTVYSHSERRRLMKERGLEEAVRHVGVPGTDKSPHTSDWSKGSIDAQTLENARVLVTRGSRVEGEDAEPYASAIRPFNLTGTTEQTLKILKLLEND